MVSTLHDAQLLGRTDRQATGRQCATWCRKTKQKGQDAATAMSQERLVINPRSPFSKCWMMGELSCTSPIRCRCNLQQVCGCGAVAYDAGALETRLCDCGAAACRTQMYLDNKVLGAGAVACKMDMVVL